MFKGSARRLDVIKMCEDCRVAVMAEEDFDPYGKPRPPVRTTEDYLREREAQRDTKPKILIDKTPMRHSVVSPHCSIRPCTSLLNSIYTYSKVLKSNGFC